MGSIPKYIIHKAASSAFVDSLGKLRKLLSETFKK
jgi:hypothetical protein